jgi:hypothetical protein
VCVKLEAQQESLLLRKNDKSLKLVASNPGPEIGSSTGQLIFWTGGGVGYNRLVMGAMLCKGDAFLGSEGRFVFHKGNELNFDIDKNENSGWWINYRGTNDANQFRDFYVGNGKKQSVLMVKGSTGSVGIGTTNTKGFKLAVEGNTAINGTLKAKEIKVKTNIWADFVFAPNYKLRPLSEVESYIKENKHLPEIPSEAEVKEEGISVSEMNAKLLQKIEELTLYVVELNKRVKDLENQGKKTK